MRKRKTRYVTGINCIYKGIKLQSSYELRVAIILDDNDVKWIRPKPLPYIDKNGKMRNYFADFYVKKWNLYLDTKSDFMFVLQKDKIECLQKQYDNIKFLHKSQILDFKTIMDAIK